MNKVLLAAVLFVIGSFQGVRGQSCNSACAADEVCNFGVCEQATNCECAVGGPQAQRCPYNRNTGDDETACKAADCCWLSAKGKCRQKNTQQRVKECTRMIPRADRTFAGWYKATASECLCAGGCYDDNSWGNYKCFEPASPKSIACPPEMYYKEEFDACYKQVTTGMKWDAALKHCQSLNPRAHLVEVESQEKQDYINKVMDGLHVWYGARRVDGGGVDDFQWTYSKTPVTTFTNWQCNQPDQESDGIRKTPDCVVGYSSTYSWYDTGCERKMPFICEASPGSLVGLGGPCGPNKFCSTPNAVCGSQGVCTCASTFTESSGQCVQVCKQKNLDIIFISDNSGSINKDELAQQKEFLKKVADSFTISDDDTRVGLIKYTITAEDVSDLDSNNTAQDVEDAIDSLAPCIGSTCWTNTAAGLDAMTAMFSSSGKSGHQKVGIIITDGESNRGDLTAAVNNIAADVTMFAVGVDGADNSELKEIAGGNVFEANNFTDLFKFVDKLRASVCGSTAGLGDPCGSNQFCSTPNSVCGSQGACTCASTFTESSGQCVQICKQTKLDMIFISDNSGSIDQAEMDKQKEFLTEVAESFTISDDDTRVGFIKYGTKAVKVNPLDSRNTAQDVKDDIDGLVPCHNNSCPTEIYTNTAAGLDMMTEMFKSVSISGHKKVSIIITDGKSNRGDLSNAVGKIASDVTMFAVGVDGADDSELKEIAGGNVFKANNFTDLLDIMDKLRTSVCG